MDGLTGSIASHDAASRWAVKPVARIVPVVAIALTLIASIALAVVATPARAMSIGSGHFHSFWIKDDHTLWAWGDNWTGQLGDGTTTPSTTPAAVSAVVRRSRSGAKVPRSRACSTSCVRR